MSTSETAISRPSSPAPTSAGWLRRLLVANLVLQMLIIVSGGLVRLTGSGLGCPTWPQCTPGSFTPVVGQEQGIHAAIEFGNRLMTFVLGFTAIALVYAAQRWAPHRPRFVWWSTVPLLGIVAQALLGGVIVLAHLDPKTVSPHFLLSIALVAFSAWLLRRYDEGDGVRRVVVSPSVHALAYAAAGAFAVVTVFGTAVTGSGPHSGDAEQPVRFGFDPVVTSRLHSAAVWVFVILVVAALVLLRREGARAALIRPWALVLGLSLAQGLVGYVQYALQIPWGLVLVHMALSALLTAAMTFAVLSTRQVDRVGAGAEPAFHAG